jgi:hypothetical protein
MFTFDSDALADGYQKTLPRGLTDPQRSGLKALLEALRADSVITDLRHAAYVLATVAWECAGTWQPIEEYGKGRNRPYGLPVTYSDAQGNTYTNIYYGRGYVQLTWKFNYEKMDAILGKGGALVNAPQMALDPGTAYAIASHGMTQGLFTGKKLLDYINGSATDYASARRIINGVDHADDIAKYARTFEQLLRAPAP